MLLELFWFCTEIQAAQEEEGAAASAAAAAAAAAVVVVLLVVVVVVLVQCKSAKDSCSLHTLRACCCLTYSHHHRGRHYYERGGSGRHDQPVHNVNLCTGKVLCSAPDTSLIYVRARKLSVVCAPQISFCFFISPLWNLMTASKE